MAGLITSEEMARRRLKTFGKPKIDWALLSRRWWCWVWLSLPMELYSEQRARVCNLKRQTNGRTHAARQNNSESANGRVQRQQLLSARIEILWRKRQLDIRDWKIRLEVPCERSIASRERENCRIWVKKTLRWVSRTLRLTIFDSHIELIKS